ncbi:MAG: hypothetical protein DPW16_20990 [Chloroflexi bacterium]|nr:hypothetical protein [Chloroflexota bacterium]
MVSTINALDILLQSVNTPVIAIDHHEHILFCNQAASHLFGLGNAPTAGQALRRVIKNPDILALLTEGEGQHTRREVNFTERNQVYSAERVELPGVGSLVMMQDITNLKELSRLRNEFVGAVTRDVRSPLTAIIGYIELLERMGPLNDQQRNFIGRIIFSVHSITALLNNLQELEKVGAVLETDRKTVQMQMMVQYALEGLHQQINEKYQQVEFYAPEKLPFVLGNPIQLRQLVHQLLDNAIKYTPAGGRITVELTPQSDFVLLIVADTGIGVLPEDQPYIFSKFYRASNVVGDTVGTGLGLSIVQSIVEQHGGRIWVESQVNQGTTFTVMLPCYGEGH